MKVYIIFYKHYIQIKAIEKKKNKLTMIRALKIL